MGKLRDSRKFKPGRFAVHQESGRLLLLKKKLPRAAVGHGNGVWWVTEDFTAGGILWAAQAGMRCVNLTPMELLGLAGTKR